MYESQALSSISSDRILPTSIAAECIESMSSDTRRAKASLSFSRWSFAVSSTCCSSAAALWPSVSICWVRRSEAARADSTARAATFSTSRRRSSMLSRMTRSSAQPLGAGLRFADRGSNAVADLGCEPLDALAQGGRALGKRSDGAVLGAGLRCQSVELGAGAGERFEEMVGALVPLRRELREALVNQSEATIDFGKHVLRSAILLGDTARQAFERAVGMIDVRSERFGRLGAGFADTSGGLLHQCGDRG